MCPACLCSHCLKDESHSVGNIHDHNCLWNIRTHCSWDLCLFLHCPIARKGEGRADGQIPALPEVFVACIATPVAATVAVATSSGVANASEMIQTA